MSPLQLGKLRHQLQPPLKAVSVESQAVLRAVFGAPAEAGDLTNCYVAVHVDVAGPFCGGRPCLPGGPGAYTKLQAL